MKKQVRLITEGAMMLALIGLFLVLNLQTAGLLEVYLIWALPLPIIFYMARFGVKQGLVLSVATLLMSLIVGNFVTLFYVATAVIVGFTYGYGVRKDKTNGWLMFTTTLITALSLFIETYLLAAMFGYDLNADMQTLLDSLKQIEGLVIPDDISTLVMAIYPVAMLLMAFLQALITHIAAIFMLKRLKITTRKMRPIESFRLPVWAGVLTLIGLFAGVLMARFTETNVRVILMLLMSVATLVLVADAYILIMIFAKKVHSRWLPTFSILALVLLPSLLIYVFIGLGLMDCFTDIRERMTGSHR